MGIEFIFLILIFLFSVVIHEVAHGAVASYLGDDTAKYAGRLTLNPISHLDPIGSIVVPLFLFFMTQATGVGIIFGWAKPVPINPNNFRDRKYGELKVSLAGPASNLLIALFFGLILRFMPNLIFSPAWATMFTSIIYINIMLGVFNLLPIPPLDGSHILFTFLRDPKFDAFKFGLTQFGFFILFFILAFLSDWLKYIVNFIFQLFTGFSLM